MGRDVWRVPNGVEGLDGGDLAGVRCDVGSGIGGVGPPGMGAGEKGSAPLALSHSD